MAQAPYILEIEDLGSVTIDATKRENFNIENEMSSHKVEDAKDAADNIRAKNDTVELDVSFSAFGQPAGIYEGLSFNVLHTVLSAFPPSVDESYKDRWRTIIKAAREHKRIKIIPPDGDPYRNMQIMGVQQAKSHTTGLMVAAVLQFEEMQTVSTGVTVVPQVQLGKLPETTFGQFKSKKNTKLKRRHAALPNNGRIVPQTANTSQTASINSVSTLWDGGA